MERWDISWGQPSSNEDSGQQQSGEPNDATKASSDFQEQKTTTKWRRDFGVAQTSSKDSWIALVFEAWQYAHKPRTVNHKPSKNITVI